MKSKQRVSKCLDAVIRIPVFGNQKKFPGMFFILCLPCEVWRISAGTFLLDYPGFPECKMRLNDFGSSHQRSGGEREYLSGDAGSQEKVPLSPH